MRFLIDHPRTKLAAYIMAGLAGLCVMLGLMSEYPGRAPLHLKATPFTISVLNNTMFILLMCALVLAVISRAAAVPVLTLVIGGFLQVGLLGLLPDSMAGYMRPALFFAVVCLVIVAFHPQIEQALVDAGNLKPRQASRPSSVSNLPGRTESAG